MPEPMYCKQKQKNKLQIFWSDIREENRTSSYF